MEPVGKDNENLDLEDILREFGGSAADDDAPAADTPAVQADPDEDVVVWDGKPVQRENKAPAMPQDTVRLDAITKTVKEQKAVSDRTITFKPVTDETIPFKPVTDQTVTFKPVKITEDEEPEYIPPQKPQKEPYSEGFA